MERFRQLVRLTKLQTYWATRWPIDLAGDKVVLIFGSGRSGTSWLANICNANNQFRYIFEPLKPDLWPISEDSIPWCVEANSISDYLLQVVNGKVSDNWVNSRNRRVLARHRLIKEIRCGLMLNALQHEFPKLKVVHIIRNPLAVAASRKSLNQLDDNSSWEWHPDLSQILKQQGVIQMLSDAEMTQLSDQIGKGVVMETIADWCLNNLVAARHTNQYSRHIVYYENLVEFPEQSAQSLFKFLQLDFDQSILSATQRRSETFRKLCDPADTQSLSSTSDRWRSVLSAEEQTSSIDLLQSFGIDSLYNSAWLPVTRPSLERER